LNKLVLTCDKCHDLTGSIQMFIPIDEMKFQFFHKFGVG